MTTERQLKIATQRQLKGKKTPPRGIRCFTDPDRPCPFGVQWPEFIVNDDGLRERKRRTLFFKTEDERDTKAAKLANEQQRGHVAQALSRAELDDRKAMLAAFSGVPWETIYGNHRAYLSLSGMVICTLKVKDAFATYLTRANGKLERRNMSKGHHSHLKQIVGAFAQAFGHHRLDKPTKAQLAALPFFTSMA